MEIDPLPLKGLLLVRPKFFKDSRGLFKESYQKNRYSSFGITCEFLQDNFSYSACNVLRGMHFQNHPPQAKLISVVEGKIFDVAVDIRPDSPTFGKWQGLYLDAEKHEQLFIPEGFAHGFCVVSPQGAWVHYKVSNIYNPKQEQTFRFDDPDIAIQWPICDPLVSERDQKSPFLKELPL